MRRTSYSFHHLSQYDVLEQEFVASLARGATLAPDGPVELVPLLQKRWTDDQRQRALAILERTFGPESDLVLDVRSNLALALGKTDPEGKERHREADAGKSLASSSTLNRLEHVRPAPAGGQASALEHRRLGWRGRGDRCVSGSRPSPTYCWRPCAG